MTIEQALDELNDVVKGQKYDKGVHQLSTGLVEAIRVVIEALKQEPCDDCISRQSIKQKLQEHHDFFINAYGGFSNLSLSDKSRVDEITNCIAMVVNEPPVNPQPKMQEVEE